MTVHLPNWIQIWTSNWTGSGIATDLSPDKDLQLFLVRDLNLHLNTGLDLDTESLLELEKLFERLPVPLNLSRQM
jgi:hypothetical protein